MKISEGLTLESVQRGLAQLDQIIPYQKPILILPRRLIPYAREFWGDSVTIIERMDLPRAFR